MAYDTPKKQTISFPKSKKSPFQNPKPSSYPQSPPFPLTPQSLPPPRRSSRFISSPKPPPPSLKPKTSIYQSPGCAKSVKNPKRKVGNDSIEVSLSPVSPDRFEVKRRRKCREAKLGTGSKTRGLRNGKCEAEKRDSGIPKKWVYYRKVVYDGGEFSVGDDVYVKRREEASSDEEDPETEECRVCYKVGTAIMIECDDCLGGFHLKCLKPPLKEVPEGDWICGYCEARKLGKDVEFPSPPQGKKRVRTAREKLLSSDLWAVHIERYKCSLDVINDIYTSSSKISAAMKFLDIVVF